MKAEGWRMKAKLLSFHFILHPSAFILLNGRLSGLHAMAEGLAS
jgi:hypothetical protein